MRWGTLICILVLFGVVVFPAAATLPSYFNVVKNSKAYWMTRVWGEESTANIQRNSSGALYTVAFNYTDEIVYDSVISLFWSTDNGVTWSESALTTGMFIPTVGSAFVIDSHDTIHLVIEDGSTSAYYVNYSLTSRWGDVSTITTDVDGHSMAIDSQDVIHIIYAGLWGGLDYQVVYQNISPTTGFSTPINIQNRFNVYNASTINNAMVVVDENDVLHIVWEDYDVDEVFLNRGIYYMNYTVASGRGSIYNVTPPRDGVTDISYTPASFAMNSSGTLELLIRNQTDATYKTFEYFNVSGDTNFKIDDKYPIVLANNTYVKYGALAVDTNDTVHMLVTNFTNTKDGNLSYLNISSNGLSVPIDWGQRGNDVYQIFFGTLSARYPRGNIPTSGMGFVFSNYTYNADANGNSAEYLTYPEPTFADPIPEFSTNTTTGTWNITIQFIDRSYGAVSWGWNKTNVDTGASSTFSNDQNPTESFESGHWQVNLSVTDLIGNTNVTSAVDIYVDYPYNMSATNGTHVSPPWPVKFIDVSGIGAASWNWSFGDGGVSAEQNPVHWYNDTGVYNVSLQIIDIVGNEFWDNKTGFIFSTKNGLPVPFDGHSDEFDNEDSILLYNGTVPTSSYWGIDTNFFGRGILNYTGYNVVERNGSAIFYAPPRNGSSESHFKYEYPSMYTWNFLINSSGADDEYPIFIWHATNVEGPSNLFPPESMGPLNSTNSKHRVILKGIYNLKKEVWLSRGVLAHTFVGDFYIPNYQYNNITISMDSSNHATVYLNESYLYYQSSASAFTIGWAGFSLDILGSGGGAMGDTDPQNLSLMKIDNWSFNYANAPGAAFTYIQLDTSTWWSSEASPTIQFTDSSNDAGYIETGWYWEFGDGTTSIEQNPTHTYSSAGTYNVNFRVETTEGFDWELNGTTVVAGEHTSPWDDSTRTTQMISNTIEMGLIVLTLGIIALLFVTLMRKL